MYNFNKNKQNLNNNASFYYNKSNQTGKISPVDNDEIQIIETKPSVNYKISPIVGDIVVPYAVR